MGKIISIINQKGGVGKTTSSLNLAAAFAKLHNKKTLLIDIDWQCSATDILIPEQYDNLTGARIPLTWTMYDAFVHPEKQVFVTHICENLDFLPSSEDMAVNDMEIMGKPLREFILRNFLRPLKKIYDIIIIDCPPNFGLTTMNIFAATDHLAVPVAPELLPARGLRVLHKMVDRMNKGGVTEDLKVDCFFFTLFEGSTLTSAKTRFARQIVASLGVNYPDKVLSSVIHRNIALQEFAYKDHSIFAYAERMKDAPSKENAKKEGIAKACADFEALAEEMVKRFDL